MVMDKLLKYLNALSREERAAYASACETTEGYLRKAVSRHQKFKAELCILLERESAGEVRCEDLLPDADWAYIRSQSCSPSAPRCIANQKPDLTGVG
jgi:DNA-binding transcriptional regulator YdaS (Cro superfamily)